MPLSWVAALKKYNEGKGKWCIPKKGSEDYEAVRKIMAGGSVPRSRSSSPAPAPKKKKLTAAEKEAARTKMGAPCADDRLSESQKVLVRVKMFRLLTKEQRKDVKDFIKERFGITKFESIPQAQKMEVRVFTFRKLTKAQKAELREFKEELLVKEGEAKTRMAEAMKKLKGVADDTADRNLEREINRLEREGARKAAEAAALEAEKTAARAAAAPAAAKPEPPVDAGVAGLPADIQNVILKMVRPDDSFNLAKTFTSGKANFRERANAIFLGLAAFVEDGPEGKVRVAAPSGYLGQARDVANELPVLKELFGHTFRAGTRKFVSDFVITEPSSEQIEMLNKGLNYTEFSFSRRRPGMTAPMSVVIEWRVKDSDLNLRTKAGREELEHRKDIDSIAADSYLKRAARPDFLEYLDTLESRRVAKVMDTREMAKAAFKIPATEAKAEFVSPNDFEAAYLSFFGDADRAKAAAAALRAKYPGRRAKFFGRKKLNILLEPSG